MSKAPQISRGLLLSGRIALPGLDLRTVSGGLRRPIGIPGVEGMPIHLLLSPEINVPEGTGQAGRRTGVPA